MILVTALISCKVRRHMNRFPQSAKRPSSALADSTKNQILTTDVNITEALAKLRDIERIARDQLHQGCIQDRSVIGALVDRLLERAREDLEARLLTLGTMDPILHRSLLIQETTEVEQDCLREAFANADVRFRARFAFYVEAVNNAEHEFLELGQQKPNAPPMRHERRVALPHLDCVDEAAPSCAVDLEGSPDLAEWSALFRMRLLQALLEAEDVARKSLIRRAHTSLARTQLALYRVLSHHVAR